MEKVVVKSDDEGCIGNYVIDELKIYVISVLIDVVKNMYEWLVNDVSLSVDLM